jgi:hypothetical protein
MEKKKKLFKLKLLGKVVDEIKKVSKRKKGEVKSLISAPPQSRRLGKSKTVEKKEKRKKKKSKRKQRAGTLRNAPGFEELPNEIKQIVVGYLPNTDAMHLTQTCKSMLSGLSLAKASSPLTDRASEDQFFRFGFGNGNHPFCVAAIVPKNEDLLHSVTFQCDWWDQGQGRRKGMFFIVAQEILSYVAESSDDYAQSLRTLSFEDGKIVSTSPFAKHYRTSLRMSFHPQINKVYQLWCKVGRGRDFTLSIRNMALYRLGFGSPVPECVTFQFEQLRAVEDPDWYRSQALLVL